MQLVLLLLLGLCIYPTVNTQTCDGDPFSVTFNNSPRFTVSDTSCTCAGSFNGKGDDLDLSNNAGLNTALATPVVTLYAPVDYANPTSTDIKVGYSLLDFTSSTDPNYANGVFTTPQDGVYFFHVQLTMNLNPSHVQTNFVSNIGFAKNNVCDATSIDTWYGTEYGGIAVNNNYLSFQTTQVLQMYKGDRLRVCFWWGTDGSTSYSTRTSYSKFIAVRFAGALN